MADSDLLADGLTRVRDLCQTGRTEDALVAVELARVLTVATPLAWNVWHALGRAGLVAGEYATAADGYERAVALRGDDVDAWNGLAVVRQRLGDTPGALEAADRAIGIKPDSAAAWITKADMLRDLDQLTQADTCYQRARWLKPGYPEARYNQSFLRFRQGRWVEAWRDYAARWDTAEFGVEQDVFHLFPDLERHGPRWGGHGLGHQTLLVWAEQGAGDTLWGLRYVDRLLACEPAAHVILLVQPAVYRQVWINYRDRCQVVARGTPVPAWDVHIPLLNLPVALHCWTPADAPLSRQVTEAGDAIPWPAGTVGLIWAGSLGHANDPRRSTALGDWLPLLRQRRLVSLQVGPRAAEAQELFDQGALVDTRPWIRDFADTANVVAGLDLVIGVDTGPMHLAAGLGVPTWWLIGDGPDWRWSHPGDRPAVNPWYREAQLWRKPMGDGWDQTIQQVAAALGGRSSSP